jgi:hypothetical protein
MKELCDLANGKKLRFRHILFLQCGPLFPPPQRRVGDETDDDGYERACRRGKAHRQKRRAKKVGLLFAAVEDKKGDAPYLDVLTNIDHLSQANYILEQMGYQPRQLEDAQPKKAQTPARPEPSLQKQRSGLTQGTTLTSNEEKQPVRGRLAALRAAAERTKSEPQRELEHIR